MLPLLLLLACHPEAPPEPDPEDEAVYAGIGALQFDGPGPRNLLFLSIDTLRRDRVDVHGASGISPFLAELAAESFVLEDHQQCSAWTGPGVACTLAGRSNLDLGFAPRLGDPDPGAQMPENTALLSSYLRPEGFWSGLVSGNYWLSPDTGTGTGYDAYQKTSARAEGIRKIGLQMLEANASGPTRWFLHLHYMEPHFPYTPLDSALVGYEALAPWPDDLRNKYTQVHWTDAWDTLTPADQALLEQYMDVLYEGEIRELDDQLRETWSELEAGGWLDDTLVVIWSDHGEQLFDHGWKSHAHSLHSDENDAIAMFWAPNIVPGRFDGPTTAPDLVPTVMTALQTPIPDEVTGQIVGEAADDRARIAEVLGYGGIAQAVTVDGVKLQYRWDGSLALFERDADRAELVDQFSAVDLQVTDLWRELEPHVWELSALIDEEPVIPPGVD